jgi:hypothetical protein
MPRVAIKAKATGEKDFMIADKKCEDYTGEY